MGLVRDAAGDRFDDLELNILVFATSIGADDDASRKGVADAFGIGLDDLDASPYAWVGDAKRVADKLRAARDRWGTSYFVLQGGATLEQAAPVIAELAGT